jgi:hypothetical protein
MFLKALNEVTNSNLSINYRMRNLFSSGVGVVSSAQKSLFKS